MKKWILYGAVLGIVAFTTGACNKEFTNPGSAGEGQVVNDINGLISLANGLQYRYTVGRQSPVYSYITASGLSTKELVVLNQGNTDEANLQAGAANVTGSNSVVTRLWEQCHLVKANSELILKNLDKVGDATTKNSLFAYAALFRGLTLGQLGTFWEQAPIAVADKATFSSRTDVLKEAVAQLEAGLAVAPASVSSKFVGGIDFPNAFNALIARYALMLGDYDKALAAANKVDLAKKSEFKYDDISRNPIFDVSYSNVNVCEPTDTALGLTGALRPDVNDKRVLFYLKSKTKTASINLGKGFFTANNASIPVYLPGEVTLIKAECHVRKATPDLTSAVAELDKVLTKTTDAWGIGAGLPAFSGDKNNKDAILTEIYRNRCIELYNSGLKLEDGRRFGRPGPKDTGPERTRNFYPYPNNERDNNPNTPADPAI